MTLNLKSLITPKARYSGKSMKTGREGLLLTEGTLDKSFALSDPACPHLQN